MNFGIICLNFDISVFKKSLKTISVISIFEYRYSYPAYWYLIVYLCCGVQLDGAGKGNLKITGFNDSKISTGHVVLELLNILRPGCIKFDWVTPGNNVEVSGHIHI